MKVDLKEMTPFTRHEKFMYAIAERLEKLIGEDEKLVEEPVKTTKEDKPKKTRKTTKKKVDDSKNE